MHYCTCLVASRKDQYRALKAVPVSLLHCVSWSPASHKHHQQVPSTTSVCRFPAM
jgi:hypothetical protein